MRRQRSPKRDELDTTGEIRPAETSSRKRIEEILVAVAKGTSSSAGESFFQSLVQHLAQSMEADFCFIGELAGGATEQIRTIAVSAEGKLAPNFQYELADTPCQNVVGKRLCSYASGVQQRFPRDRFLAAMGAEGYVGTSLFDSRGQPLGILVVLSRRPLHKVKMAESILRIFAARASVELERVKAEHALRDSEALKAAILNSALSAIISMDHEGKIIEFNPAAEKIFGYSRAAVMGKPMAELIIPPSLRKKHMLGVRHYLATGEGPVIGKRTEMTAMRSDGSEFPAELTVARLESNGSPVFTGYVRDLGELKQRELERTRYTAQLRALAETSLVINSTLSQDEVLKIVTEKVREIIGAHQSVTSTTLNQNWEQAINALSLSDRYAPYRAFEAKPDGSGIYAIVCETNRPIRMTQDEIEAHPRWRAFGEYAGQHPPMRGWLAAPLIDRKGSNIGLIQLSDKYEGDFTESDEAILVQIAQLASVAIENARLFEETSASRRQLQALSRSLVEVQEAERRNIARELHDEIGQLLTGLKLTLETTSHLPPGKVMANFSEAQLLVNDLVGRVRQLSLDLRPAMLDDFGLLPALHWHFERYTHQTQVKVRFRHTGLKRRRFSSEVETAAYRIIQEALSNVARYAGANEAEVGIWTDRSTLSIRVEDRGVGFDADTRKMASMTGGLSGMRERAAMLGGHLKVESAPGAGTLVMVEIRLRKEDTKKNSRRC